jgi:hypothetical protein
VKVLLVILLVCPGFVAGALVGTAFVPAGSGMAGPPIVLGWGVGGLVLAAVTGLVLARRLPGPALRAALVIAFLMTSLAVAWVAYRVSVVQAVG